MDALLDRLRVFRTRPWLAWPLVAGNLVAVWWGWTVYYDQQLAATAPYLWPFVPDSPNAVLMFAVAVGLSQFGFRHALLDLAAWVLNVKVGIWTVFVLLYYYDEFFADDPQLRWLLLWLHAGMVAQAFVLHRDLRRPPVAPWVFGVVAAFVLVGDWLDYGPVDIHPYLRGPSRPVVSTVTVMISLATLAAATLLYSRRAPRTPESRPGC